MLEVILKQDGKETDKFKNFILVAVGEKPKPDGTMRIVCASKVAQVPIWAILEMCTKGIDELAKVQEYAMSSIPRI